MNALKNKISTYFGHLKGNSKVCICFHPMWGIPYTFYYFYLSLYLKETGLTDENLGTLMVIGTIFAFIFSFFASPIVDRLGRKKSTFIFDLLSSALPCFVYLFTGHFIFALIAQILYNSSRIMNIGYYLVMIEDADDEEKIVAFNIFNILTVVAGLLIPLGGILVNSIGLVAAERAFLTFSFVSMTAMIFFRNHMLKETKVGEKLMGRPVEGGILGFIKDTFRSYKEAFLFLAKDRMSLIFVCAYMLFYIYMNLGSNYSLYFTPYFTDKMGMDTMQASTLGSIYYAGMIGAMVLINPLFGKKSLISGVIDSAAITLLGLIGMIFCPSGSFIFAIVATLIMAVGYGMLKSEVDGAMAVYTESEARSSLYAVANLLSSGVGILVTSLCAILYVKNAAWVYILCAIMVAGILGGGLTAKKLDQNKPKAQ